MEGAKVEGKSEKLEAGDILFIDSSHEIRTGNDVVELLLNILPRLKPGVLIHIHDIFLPFEYPIEWVIKNRWPWNEQYLSLNLNEVRTPKKITIILVTASKGLCGAFNSNLIKKTNQLLFQTYNQQRKEGNLTLYVIGKKGYDAFKNKEVAINTDYQNLLQNLNYEECASFTETLMKSFLNGDTDVVECVYAKFKNAATQVYESERFLPVPKIETSSSNSSSSIDFIFDPERTQLIEELVPKIIKTQFFRFLLDTNASEHGARMVAMDSATTNANELLNKLKLMYNRERQAAITKELLEIVAGAAALENG